LIFPWGSAWTCKCEKSRGGKLLSRSATFSVERT
jgi:hypothetical protein